MEHSNEAGICNAGVRTTRNLEKDGLIDLAQVGKIVARKAFRTLKLAPLS